MGTRKLLGRRPNNSCKWWKQGRRCRNSASASFRQLPHTPNTCEDGSWKMESRRLFGGRPKFHLNGRNTGGVGQIQLPLASVSFRQLPKTPNTCVGGSRKTEKGKLLEKRPENSPPKGRNKGVVGQIQLPSASVSFRRHPTHGQKEVGRWKEGISWERRQNLT